MNNYNVSNRVQRKIITRYFKVETSLQPYVITLIEFYINSENCHCIELMSEIYDRMNPYEQDFIKCAATLGRVFKRSMIENVMINSIPLHTTRSEYN